MTWMNLSLDAALARLKFWQDALENAEKAQDVVRVNECARFIQEYGTLIAEITAAKPPEPK